MTNTGGLYNCNFALLNRGRSSTSSVLIPPPLSFFRVKAIPMCPNKNRIEMLVPRMHSKSCEDKKPGTNQYFSNIGAKPEALVKIDTNVG